MKKLFRAFAVTLLCALANVVVAQNLTAEEKEWVQALTPIYKEAKEAGIDVTIAVVTNQESGATPAMLVWKADKQQCMFVIAVRNNHAADVLSHMAKKVGASRVFRTAILAHEYGHCRQHLAEPALSERATEGGTVPLAAVKEEALGDVFALAWLAQNRAEEFDAAFRFMRDLRKIPQDGTERYETLDYVRKAEVMPHLMAKKPASPFEHAMNLVYGANFPQRTALATDITAMQAQ